MNERKIQKSLKRFCQNPYWNEYHQKAPTDLCRRYIELKFCYSDHLGKIPDYDAFKKECDILESNFTKADWLHLYTYCANNPKKVYYKNKMNETGDVFTPNTKDTSNRF